MLFLLLSTSYSVVFVFYPWRQLAELDVPLWLMQYAARVPEHLAGTKRKPVIILGSSLIIAPSQQLNDVKEGPLDSNGQREKKTKSTFYEQEIKTLTGLKLSIENLAIHSVMVTDQQLIVRQLIAGLKAPQPLIYTIAPRDFIDNVLGDDTPTPRVFNFISHSQTFLPRETQALIHKRVLTGPQEVC